MQPGAASASSSAADAASAAQGVPATDDAGADVFDDEGGEYEVVETEDAAAQSIAADDADDDNDAVDVRGADADSSGMRSSEYGTAPSSQKGAARVKKLAKVKGEVGALNEEFNEAGEAFEPFHLRGEREDGFYDEGGNYVWKKKSADDYDPWLEELDAMDPRSRRDLQAGAALKAKTGTSSSEGGPRNGDEEEEGEGEDDDEEEDEPPSKLSFGAVVGHLTVLLEHQRSDETVAGMLRRLSGRSSGSSSRSQQHGGGTAAEAPKRDLTVFNAVTDAADALVGSGTIVDVYSLSRAAVFTELNDARLDAGLPALRDDATAGASSSASSSVAAAGVSKSSAFDRSGAVASAQQGTGGTVPLSAAATAAVQWKYRWSNAADAPVFGPFGSPDMAAWKTAGYFSAPGGGGEGGGTGVFVQQQPPGNVVTAPAANDDDDDIFGGVGKYATSSSTPSAVAEWVPVESVVF